MPDFASSQWHRASASDAEGYRRYRPVADRALAEPFSLPIPCRRAPSPVFFARPRVGPSPGRFALKGFRRRISGKPECRGRAGRQGSERTRGPRRLATSRLVEVRSRLRSFELRRASRKSAKSDGVPRAVFLGLLRIAPGGLTFQATLLSFRIVRPPIHRFRPRSEQATCDRLPAPAITGPSGARLARRDVCGFNRRALAAHLRCRSFPGHRSPPRI